MIFEPNVPGKGSFGGKVVALRGRDSRTTLGKTLGEPNRRPQQGALRLSGRMAGRARLKRLMCVIETLRFAEESFRAIVRQPTEPSARGGTNGAHSFRPVRGAVLDGA
jgi:hypothetical protein